MQQQSSAAQIGKPHCQIAPAKEKDKRNEPLFQDNVVIITEFRYKKKDCLSTSVSDDGSRSLKNHPENVLDQTKFYV